MIGLRFGIRPWEMDRLRPAELRMIDLHLRYEVPDGV